MENTFIQRFSDWQTMISVKKHQVENQSDSLAGYKFGRTIGMVHWNNHCIPFASCFSYLFIATSFPHNAQHFLGKFARNKLEVSPVISDNHFPPKMMSSWLIILEICCPERMTGGCQLSAHVRQKSVFARAHNAALAQQLLFLSSHENTKVLFTFNLNPLFCFLKAFYKMRRG